MKSRLTLKRLRGKKGQTMAEYALVAGLVAAVVFATYQKLATPLSAILTQVAAFF